MIGQKYKEVDLGGICLDTDTGCQEEPQGRTSGGGGGVVIGHQYKPQERTTQNRQVVGSRYQGGGSSCSICGGGGGDVQARVSQAPSRWGVLLFKLLPLDA